MAELLAVASGVAGLLSLTIEVYSVSSRYISCVKHASSTVLDVQRELKALKSILSELDKALEHGEAEKLFANRPSALSAIEDAEEYCEALRKLQAKLMKESSKTGFSAKLKTFAWPFNEERTQSILDVLRRHVNVFGQALSIDSYWVEAEILKEVQFLGREKREKMMASSLEWLSPAKNDMQPKQHDFFSKRVGTTGDWLLEHDVFRRWVDEPLPPILWCLGDPGAGKTILSSMVVDHVARKCTPDGIAHAVVFCDYKDQASQTTRSLLGNIAKQLIQGRPSGSKALEELHDRLQQRSAQPTIKDFEALIRSVTSDLKDTYVVIDALDELLPEHRKTLLSVIRSLQQHTIKFLVTSRPHSQDLERAFRDHTKLVVQASDADIHQFVRTTVDEDEDLLDAMEDDEKLKEDVISATTVAAHGMILLPVLQLKHLKGLFSKSQIRRALTTMPKDLFGMYAETIDRIGRQDSSRKELALTVLGWISLAKRPLLIGELRHALAVEFRDGKDQKHKLDAEDLVRPQLLIDVCAGLVTIETESKVVRLVHFTAQEFFDKNGQSHFPGVPAQMAGTCLTYLLVDDFKSGPCLDKDLLRERLDEFQFLEYASVYWGDHVRGALETQYLDLVLELIRCDKKLCASVEACNLREPEFFRWCNLFGQKPSDFGPLHCAAAQGLDQAIKVLLAEGADPCKVDGTFKTPVHWATWRGHSSSMAMLLDTGIDPNLASEDEFTLLETAVDQDREEAARLLLERGCDINRQGFGKSTALLTAALMGHENLVNLLLEKGADWQLQNQFGETPFIKAALRGHEEISRTFLALGVDLQHANGCGNTALHCAAFSGRFEIVEQLLEAGAEVDQKTANDVTALHMAASQGHEEVVRLLIAKGADIEAKTSTEKETFQPLVKEIGRCIPEMVRLSTCGLGATSLFEAALHGQVTVVKSLLELGADAATTNASGETPLIAAASSGMHNNLGGPRLPLTTTRSAALENTLALLNHGVDVNAAAKFKHTALHIAARDGFLELVQLLIDHGTDVHARTATGDNTLHYAARNGQSEVVEWLLARGLDPHVKNDGGCTMFHFAASNGNVETMKVLIDSDNGIDIEECDAKGLTPLIRSVWSKKIENVQFLLDRGADIDREALNLRGVNIAYSAVFHDDVDLLKLLIDRGARLDVLSDVGTLLHKAAQDGKVKVLPTLLESGLSQTATAQNGRTALHLAAWCGKTEAVQFLLEHGSEIEAVDDLGKTPLLLAASKGEGDTVSLLCQKGSDVKRKCKDGSTILDSALENKHVAVARLLVKHGAEKPKKSRILHLTQQALNDGDCSMLHFLLENDDDPITTTSGLSPTPFHASAQRDDAKLAAFLVERGFDVNKQDVLGRHPLWVAVDNKALSVVEILLENGAETTWDDQQDNLVDLALEVGYEGVALCLVRHGVEFDRKAVLLRAARLDMKELAQVLLDLGDNTEGIGLDAALHRALVMSSVGMCKLLLEHGADANSRTESGDAALHIACIEDEFQSAALLLSHGANIEGQNADQRTPLLCAQSLHMTELLVRQGASLKATDEGGWTALHFAVARLPEDEENTSTSAGVVEFLVSRGVDLDVSDKSGNKPLHVACSGHSTHAVRVLLASGAKVDSRNAYGDQPLHLALTENHRYGPEEFYSTWYFDDSPERRVIEILDLLLQHGADVNAPGEFGHTALHRAVDSGCSETLCKWLLQKGASIEAEDDQELTPLLRACDQGDRGRCIPALLQHGIDAHKYRYRHQFALERALAKDDWGVANDLIQHGITLDPNHRRLRRISIHICARRNCSFLLELLLRADNVDIEKRDFRGYTILGAAVDAVRLENVQVLLRHGANANADGPCQCGNPSHKATLLRLAAGQGNAEILRALLDAGADANVRNDNNNTALTFAAEFGHDECVEILLGVDGIDVNAVDNDGDSALLCAVHGRMLGATRILLANKAVDRTLRNKLGFTAEELAGEGGRVGFKELFAEVKVKEAEEKVKGLAIRVSGTKEGCEEE